MKEIPLTKGYVATVDDCDFDRVSAYNWYVQVSKSSVYARAYIEGKHVYMHCFLIQAPTGMYLDHQDRNGLNNTRQNLRFATRSQNGQNQRIRSDNTTGVKGVSWHKQAEKWVARVAIDGKVYWLGCFTTKEEAAEAVRKKRLELHKEFSCDK